MWGIFQFSLHIFATGVHIPVSKVTDYVILDFVQTYLGLLILDYAV
jgi:hypothetical protein